ncbi:MAG TPA: DUF1648 domain-containing protein [Gemmatimonadaceae bacterium]|nr:DUF1648 domain-containing protein [Gemmatimonadaceae bacterium]
MNRVLLLATLVLTLLLFALSAGTYPSLPAQIPMHFNGAGVDRWAPKTFFAWFGLPFLSLGLVAINYVIGALLARRPDLMNIPRKQRLLALPRERQQRVMRWWWVLVQTIGLVEASIMSVAQYGLWRAASAHVYEGRAIAWLVTVIAIGVLPLSLVIVWRMRAEVERQEGAVD